MNLLLPTYFLTVSLSHNTSSYATPPLYCLLYKNKIKKPILHFTTISEKAKMDI